MIYLAEFWIFVKHLNNEGDDVFIIYLHVPIELVQCFLLFSIYFRHFDIHFFIVHCNSKIQQSSSRYVACNNANVLNAWLVQFNYQDQQLHYQHGTYIYFTPFSAKQKLDLAGSLYLWYFMFTVYDKNEVTVDEA